MVECKGLVLKNYLLFFTLKIPNKKRLDQIRLSYLNLNHITYKKYALSLADTKSTPCFLGSKIIEPTGQLICSKMFENLFEKDKWSTIVSARA